MINHYLKQRWYQWLIFQSLRVWIPPFHICFIRYITISISISISVSVSVSYFQFQFIIIFHMLYNTSLHLACYIFVIIFWMHFIQTKRIIHKTKLNKGRNMMEPKEKAMLVGHIGSGNWCMLTTKHYKSIINMYNKCRNTYWKQSGPLKSNACTSVNTSNDT